MLSDSQRRQFADKGFFRIRGAFTKGQAKAMESAVWDELFRLNGISSDNPETWTITQATSLQGIKREPVFDPIGGKATIDAIDDLLGAGLWQMPSNWGQFLVNFPEKDQEWTVPHAIWHSDFEYHRPSNAPHGLLLTSFISSVGPRGGGTAIIEGSHRVVEKFVAKQSNEVLQSMKSARKALIQSDPWFIELSNHDTPDRIDRFMKNTSTVSGIEVKVGEMTGEAGDVIVAHPWLLHTPALNCATRPRMMRVQRIRPVQ